MNDERTPSERLRTAFIHICGQSETLFRIADAIETLSSGIPHEVTMEQATLYHGGFYILNQHILQVAHDINLTLEDIRTIADEG